MEIVAFLLLLLVLDGAMFAGGIAWSVRGEFVADWHRWRARVRADRAERTGLRLVAGMELLKATPDQVAPSRPAWADKPQVPLPIVPRRRPHRPVLLEPTRTVLVGDRWVPEPVTAPLALPLGGGR